MVIARNRSTFRLKLLEVLEDQKDMAFKISNDHWTFLEEIEAPMWVDLTLEANSNNQHIDDDWFNRSHLFHQCSSRQLKAAFSHAGEDIMALNSELLGPSSPQLPTSVSKSRGKDFVSKKWRGEKPDFSLDKQHPVKVLSGTSSGGNSGSGDKMKPKSSFIHVQATSSSKSSSVSKSSLTENHILSCSKPISAHGDPKCSSNSMTNKADEGSTTSTITCESGQQQQQKFMEKSNQALSNLSQTNGLLSFIKTGLRKSGITRPASRVEINRDRRQSRGRQSSSGKSSVGSSSNPCYDGRTSTSTSMRYKERTPDSRNVAGMTHAAKNRIKSSKASKTETNKIGRGNPNNRMGPNVAQSIHMEAAKPKTLRRKPLEPVRVDEKKLIPATLKSKEKTVVGDRLATGKENMKGRMAGGQKSNSKGNVAVTLVWSPKGTKKSILHRHDKTGLSGKGKVSSQNHLVSRKDVPKRPHFR